MMCQAPFSHNRSAARHNPCHAIGGHGNEGKSNACMNSEVINTLFGLFNECVTENFPRQIRSEEHTSELQSLMRSSYAVFCLKKKTNYTNKQHDTLKQNTE